MKSLLIIFTLVFTVMFSSMSFSDWKLVAGDVSGNIFYIDFDRIRKNDGLIYYWKLSDYKNQTKDGIFSDKSYVEGDCKLFRFRELNALFYIKPMGEGNPYHQNKPQKEWNYLAPNTINETLLKSVCSR